MNKGKICIPVCAETADEFIENIKRAAQIADVIELRFDCLNIIEPEVLWNELKKIRKTFKGKLLATYRPRSQGGKRDLSLKERKKFWQDTHVYEFVDWGDFENDFESGWNSYFKAVFNRMLFSYHNFQKTPDNLNVIFQHLSELTDFENPRKDKDVIKIAVQTDDITDSLAVWKLLEQAEKNNKQIIPIAMGEAGRWTRILSLANGAPLAYAALDAGRENAAGQITAREMIEVYRVKELDEQTEIYGIVGNPVSHSLSPFMHNAAFRFHDLNAVYIPFEVKNLDEFIRRMVCEETREINWNLKGFSVTIPHKQAIIKYLDFTDETARKIGAVNTVKIENGKLYGYNTDAQGFIEPLKKAYGNLQRAKVAVAGNGGAARAAIFALKAEGAEVTIFARNLEKAEVLANEFKIELKQLLKADFKNFDIVVNATPLGTKGELENETPAVAAQIENVKLVYDLIYNPSDTKFIREARKANVPIVGGLAMLVAQGVKQFEIWTGKDAPAREMRAAALEKIPD